MARQRSSEPSTASVRSGFRSFKTEESGFKELNPGESIEGVFVSRRRQTIKDTRTKAPKDIWVYRVRTDTEGIVNIGGRAMLDRQFEDIVDDMFAGSENAIKGLRIVINRGDDKKTRDGNPIGSYEVLIEDRTGDSGHIE